MEYLESDRAGRAAQFTDPVLSEDRYRQGRRQVPAVAIAIATLILVLWEVAARQGWISALFFPAPTTIASTIVSLSISGVLIENTLVTLSRLLLGIAVGGGLGVLLGLAMGMSRSLRAVLEPFVAAVHPIPKIAVFPLILIMLGIGEASKVAIASLAAFFPLLINTIAGVRQIHPIYFEVAQNYGAGRLKIFLRVTLPGSLPTMLAGLLLALNITLLVTVAVEMIGAREGLGAMIWLSWMTMRTERLYASLTMIILLGIGFNVLFHRLMQRLVPWQGDHG